MVRASDSVTLATLKDIKTMNFDETEGLTIASDDGKTKVIITDETVSFWQNEVKVAEFSSEFLKLGINATSQNGAFIDLLNGLGKINAYKPNSSSKAYLQMKSNGIDLTAYDELSHGNSLSSSIVIDTEKMSSTEWQNTILLYNRDSGGGSAETQIQMKTDSYGNSFIDLVSKKLMRNGSPFFEWTLIKQTMPEETIVGLEDAGYSEFLLTCQIDPKGGQGYNHERVMASTIIPAEVFFGYTTDHGNGASQAYYSTQYNSGVSYLGNNKVKLYHPSGCYARLYAR